VWPAASFSKPSSLFADAVLEAVVDACVILRTSCSVPAESRRDKSMLAREKFTATSSGFNPFNF
jgi:hypothetical protein